MPKTISNVVDVYVYRIAAGTPHFLLLHRSPQALVAGTWQAVHGKIEPGETAFEAAQRELAEETQIVPQQWHQLEFVNTFFMARTDQIHLCPCFAARTASGAEPTLNDEHDDYAWLEAEAALNRYHWPGQRAAVREICELIIPGGPTASSLRLDLG